MAALYEGGEEWFAGTIEKARADGRFNILYEDGDSELGEDGPAKRRRCEASKKTRMYQVRQVPADAGGTADACAHPGCQLEIWICCPTP